MGTSAIEREVSFCGKRYRVRQHALRRPKRWANDFCPNCMVSAAVARVFG